MPSVKSYRRRKMEVEQARHACNTLRNTVDDLQKENEDLRRDIFLAEKNADDARRHAERAERARYIDHLRHEQMKKLLEAYQNQILDWYNVQGYPPYILADTPTPEDLPSCLKPRDTFKYIFREENNGPNHTSQVVS